MQERGKSAAALQTTELLFEERKGVYMCVKGRIVTLKP